MDRDTKTTIFVMVSIAVFTFIIVTCILYSNMLNNENNNENNNNGVSIDDFWNIMKVFITPNDASVIEATNRALGTNADGFLTANDVNTIQRWICYNISPIIKDPDYNVYPSDTLSNKVGDCSDMGLLAYSMLSYENRQTDYEIYLVIVNVSKTHTSSFHSSILVLFDDTCFLSDPSYREVENILFEELYYETTDLPKVVSDIVSKTHFYRYKVIGVVSFNGRYEFESTSDFYDWVDEKIGVI